MAYVPPPGLRFRLVGYVSQCVIVSRTHQEPHVSHSGVSYEEFPDQWFTLLHGSGNRAGRYAIKSHVTGFVLFSRNPVPKVGHTDGDGRYDDK